jgi:hypothetical protein
MRISLARFFVVSYSPPPAELAVQTPLAAPRLAWIERVVLATGGSVLVGLLATAALLTPDPAGMGTHQQLGLPRCTIVEWYGIRCPSCGMTTSWAHVVRGRLVSALAANAGGTLLALVAMICGPWLIVSGLRGRWLAGPPREGWTLTVGLAIVVVTLTQWTLRLSLGW